MTRRPLVLIDWQLVIPPSLPYTYSAKPATMLAYRCYTAPTHDIHKSLIDAKIRNEIKVNLRYVNV